MIPMKSAWSMLQDCGKKIAVSLFIAVGVLAIANVDAVWRAPRTADYLQVKQQARKTLRERLPSMAKATRANADADAAPVTSVEKLSASLEQDELGDENPFAALSNLDALNRLFARGVVKFERQAYRSPEYQEEVGYDLLSYDIELKDHTHANILAYLERPLTDNPDAARLPVVMIIDNRSGLAHQTMFKNGDLLEQSDLPLSQAQALVSHKLNSGVPFFSVAR